MIFRQPPDSLALHLRKLAIPHVFERGAASGPKSVGPGVPTWAQVKLVYEIMQRETEVIMERQRWNQFAPLGSPGVFACNTISNRITWPYVALFVYYAEEGAI